jgi:hypothetical protein
MFKKKLSIVQFLIIFMLLAVGILVVSIRNDKVKAFNQDVEALAVEKDAIFVSRNFIEKEGVTHKIDTLINEIIDDQDFRIFVDDEWRRSEEPIFSFSDVYMYVNSHLPLDATTSLNRVFQINLDTFETDLVISSIDEPLQRLTIISDDNHLLALNKESHELHIVNDRGATNSYSINIPAVNDTYEMYMHSGILYRYHGDLSLSNIIDAYNYFDEVSIDLLAIDADNLLMPLSFMHEDTHYALNNLIHSFAMDIDGETEYLYHADDIMSLSSKGEKIYHSLRRTQLNQYSKEAKVFLDKNNRYLMAFKFKTNYSGILYENETKFLGFLFDYIEQETYYVGISYFEPLYIYVKES